MADDGLSRLSDNEKTALVALLKRTIDADRFPLSPRIGQLRGILAKLEGRNQHRHRYRRCGITRRHGTRRRSGGHLGDNG